VPTAPLDAGRRRPPERRRGASRGGERGPDAAYLDGSAPEERLRAATMTVAFALTVSGDWEGAPTREELALLAQARGTVPQ
jgi:2-dehydro-3-deoxygluconokinase